MMRYTVESRYLDTRLIESVWSFRIGSYKKFANVDFNAYIHVFTLLLV